MIFSGRKPNVPLFKSFSRYTVSASVATLTDFSVLYCLKEFLGLRPFVATFIGACCGAIVAFLLGRNWTFLNREGKVSRQGAKFFLVVIGSILLNTFGEYLLTEVWPLSHYMIARVIVAVTVGLSWNFPMQRYFVFNDEE